jgi:hypothetical protein
MSDEPLVPPRHESGDIGARFVPIAVAGLGVALIAMLGLSAWMFPETIGARFVSVPLPQPPSPALQSSPRADLAAFRQEQLQELNGFGWTDQPARRVRIPIDAAMRKLAAEGIPDWPRP